MKPTWRYWLFRLLGSCHGFDDSYCKPYMPLILAVALLAGCHSTDPRMRRIANEQAEAVVLNRYEGYMDDWWDRKTDSYERAIRVLCTVAGAAGGAGGIGLAVMGYLKGKKGKVRP